MKIFSNKIDFSVFALIIGCTVLFTVLSISPVMADKSNKPLI